MAYVGTKPLRVGFGMTGDATLTSHGALYGNGTSAFGITNAGVDGDICLVNSSGVPVFSNTSELATSFTFQLASIGSTLSVVAENTDNTDPASGSAMIAQVGGSSGGLIRNQFVISGGGAAMLGINNATASPEADPLTYNGGTTNFNPSWTFNKTGTVTRPRNVAFLSFLPTDVTNVTGQSATYTLGAGTALTEVFDTQASITTGGLMTAPITARYDLRFNAGVIGVTVATKFNIALVTSNRTYLTTLSQAAAALNQYIQIWVIADMDAADTCTFQVACTGEAADTDDIDGASGTLATWCCGTLLT